MNSTPHGKCGVLPRVVFLFIKKSSVKLINCNLTAITYRCGHCKQLAPFYDELGKHYADSNTVVIAKMDATINELSHTSISSFPTIKLYKKGDNAVVDYNGERTTDEFIKFIESGGEVKGVPDVVSIRFYRFSGQGIALPMPSLTKMTKNSHFSVSFAPKITTTGGGRGRSKRRSTSERRTLRRFL